MRHRGEHNEVPFRLKLLVTVWWLANEETYRQVANRFQTTRGNYASVYNLIFI